MHPLDKLVVAVHAVIGIVCFTGIGWLVWSELSLLWHDPDAPFFFWRLVLAGLVVAFLVLIFRPPGGRAAGSR